MSARDLAWALIHGVPPEFWASITWLGDSALMLPAALAIALWLALSRATWPSALLWCLLFALMSAAVVASKVAFLGWGVGSARLNFTGISGHAASSAAVWPVVLWLLGARAPRPLRIALVALGAGVGSLIAVSRLPLFAHSASEVASGWALGSLVAGAFLVLQHGRLAHPQVRAWLVAPTLLLPLVFQQPGQPAQTQGMIERTAVRLAGIERAYTREDLHLGRSPRRGACCRDAAT